MFSAGQLMDSKTEDFNPHEIRSDQVCLNLNNIVYKQGNSPLKYGHAIHKKFKGNCSR